MLDLYLQDMPEEEKEEPTEAVGADEGEGEA